MVKGHGIVRVHGLSLRQSCNHLLCVQTATHPGERRTCGDALVDDKTGQQNSAKLFYSRGALQQPHPMVAARLGVSQLQLRSLNHGSRAGLTRPVSPHPVFESLKE